MTTKQLLWSLAGCLLVGTAQAQTDSSNVQSLQQVEIKSTLLPAIGVRRITSDDIFMRYPAAFSDVGRIVTTLPEVAQGNDGTNHFSVRGATPNALQWFLDGAEIVNPSHLSNAGTRNDRPTYNGGGQLAIGLSQLSSATLHKGTPPVAQGNALNSFELDLKSGDTSQRRHHIQAGLIGLEAGLQGYFKNRKGKKGSYFINYRYSTVGLLGRLGVSFGGEKIAFQDLNAKFVWPENRLGRVSIFAVAGNSRNVFEANADTSLWLVDKDNQNITYRSQMAAVGLRQEKKWDNGWAQTTVLAYSVQNNSRYSAFLRPNLTIEATNGDTNSMGKWYFNTSFQKNISAQGQFTTGLVLKQEAYRYESRQALGNASSDGQLTYVQPYAQYLHRQASWEWSAGLRGQWVSWNNRFYVEPQASIRYLGFKTFNIKLQASENSQFLAPYTAFIKDSNGDYLNANYGFARARHIELALDMPTPIGRFTLNGFYQALRQVPTTVFLNSNPSNVINDFEMILNYAMVNEGRGTNTGVSLAYDNGFLKKWRLAANVTLFDNKLEGTDGRTYAARFNSRYVANAVIGRHFDKKYADKTKNFGISLRLTSRGGYRETPIDVVNSQQADLEILDYSRFNQAILKDYFRADINIYWKKMAKNRVRTWLIDIQNVANTQNEDYRYFDVRQQKVVTKYQLGFIPNLAYRLEF